MESAHARMCISMRNTTKPCGMQKTKYEFRHEGENTCQTNACLRVHLIIGQLAYSLSFASMSKQACFHNRIGRSLVETSTTSSKSTTATSTKASATTSAKSSAASTTHRRSHQILQRLVVIQRRIKKALGKKRNPEVAFREPCVATPQKLQGCQGGSGGESAC